MPSTFTRRGFLGASVAAPAILRGQAKDHPNVLFIAIDDLNDWVGCLGGNPDTKTPHLDSLASRGILFTNAHCTAPMCNPSRASLMTGMYPSVSGCYENNQPMRQSPVLKSAVTISQHFMAHGYHASGSGKIYHGSFPDPPSWNEYWPSQQKNRPADPEPPKKPVNGIPNTSHFDWGPVSAGDSQMGDMQSVEWVSRQLEKKQAKPFFLACGIFRPHLPWYVPQKYFDMFDMDKIRLPSVKEDDLDDVPPLARKFARPDGDHKSVIDHKQWRRAVQSYLASIAFADACVGKLIAAFDASPHAKNTVLVLWSDHGWHLGEKLHWRKFTLWEEATRNVFMMIAPGLTRPGQRCSRPVSMIDIYPTLNDLCNLKPREELHGRTLRPLLQNAAAEWKYPALCTYHRGNHSLRGERWRYTRYVDNTEELYDHKADPMEWHNLAGKPEYNTVKQELARWLPQSNALDTPRVKTSGIAD